MSCCTLYWTSKNTLCALFSEQNPLSDALWGKHTHTTHTKTVGIMLDRIVLIGHIISILMPYLVMCMLCAGTYTAATTYFYESILFLFSSVLFLLNYFYYYLAVCRMPSIIRVSKKNKCSTYNTTIYSLIWPLRRFYCPMLTLRNSLIRGERSRKRKKNGAANEFH